MKESAVADENAANPDQLGTTSGAEEVGHSLTLEREFLIHLPLALEEENKHKWLAGTAILVCSGAWLVGSLIYKTSAQTMPWAITLSGAGLITLFWLAKRRTERQLYIFKLAESRSFVISDGFAVSLCAASVFLGSLIWWHLHSPHPVPMVRRQFIDIELVSSADAVDRHDILPGTEKKADEQKKLQSNAVRTQHGKTLVQADPRSTSKVAPEAPQPLPQKQEKPHPQPKGVQVAQKQTTETQAKKSERENSKPQDSSSESLSQSKTTTSTPPKLPINVPFGAADRLNSTFTAQQPSKWKTQTVATAKPVAISRGVASFEEVAPPEMVELTDSEGESRATELWQAGGRNAGGKGAKSSLTAYLKELHRRIKRAWHPPGGETRTAEILFRIKKTGQLHSIKLMHSSGNNELDDAAMVAIAGCAPFKSLPPDLPGDYLDLLYTFNYTVDSLAEARKQQFQ